MAGSKSIAHPDKSVTTPANPAAASHENDRMVADPVLGSEWGPNRAITVMIWAPSPTYTTTIPATKTMDFGGRHVHTPHLVEVGTRHFTMTAPTQTNLGTVYLMDDPVTHAIFPTCSIGGKGDESCMVEYCMWDNWKKPINITTAEPAATITTGGSTVTRYTTHKTELRGPHWGIPIDGGVYYPTKTSYANVGGTKTQYLFVETPDNVDLNDTWIHGAPACYDSNSCSDYCRDKVHRLYQAHGLGEIPFENDDPWTIAAFVAAAFILLLASLCCCAAALRRRRNNDPNRRNSSLSEKLGRKPTQPPTEIIVNQATGTAVDTATGQTVDPSTATAVISGSAAGAEAGRKQSTMTTSGNDDGKGTSARRAEEGRGRVNFEDGGRPGNEAPPPERTTVTEVEPAPQPAPAPAPAPATETERTERVETKPAGQTDGTFDLATTGRQILDTGSMRGRKRGRVEGAAKGLPFGF